MSNRPVKKRDTRSMDYSSLNDECKKLNEQLSCRNDELEIIINAGKALTSSLDINKIIGIITEYAQKLVPFDCWSFFLVAKGTSELYLRLSKNLNDDDISTRCRLEPGADFGAAWAITNKKNIIIDNLDREPRLFNELSWLDPVNPDGIKSIICVPMMVKNSLIGLLEIGLRKNLNDSTPYTSINDRLELLTHLMDHAAIAIDKVHLYERLEEITVTDDLTQLYNMRYMDNNLDHEIRRCQRYSSSIGSIFLDLDYFKTVNDRFGHRMGSKVLTEVAVILKKNLRDIDIIARFGGDEFVVVLPEVTFETTAIIAERIRKEVESTPFLVDEDLNIELTASFGVSAFPNPAKNKTDLIDSADKAMYVAKNSGRNRVCT